MVHLRGQEGAYLDTWGNLYDVAWVSPTQAQGTFHNTNVDQVGRFTWTFAAADCGALPARHSHTAPDFSRTANRQRPATSARPGVPVRG
jgi:hypothetical protein